MVNQPNQLLNRAIINPQAFRHNLLRARAIAGQSPIWAVMKANAYGHSIKTLLPIACELAQGIAVARIEEAVMIRQELCDLPVLVLGGGYSDADYDTAQINKFELVCHQAQQLSVVEQWSASAKNLDLPLKLWVKCNVGMNRLGVEPEQLLPAIEQLQRLAGVEVQGVLAHLGTADEPNSAETQRQMQVCIDAFNIIKQRLPQLKTSLSNSAHLLNPAYHSYPWHGQTSDWVRPGICLYGASPFAALSAKALNLKAVMTLQAQIVSVRQITAGTQVGYGATWQALQDETIVALAIGYGDGYPRNIQGAQAVIVDEFSHPIGRLEQAGRVSMDLLLFRVLTMEHQPLVKNSSGQIAVQVGQWVELWGEHIAVDDVAALSQTIGYERLCQINQRVAHISPQDADIIYGETLG